MWNSHQHYLAAVPPKTVEKLRKAGYSGARYYAAVLDWLFEKGIHIQLDPGFTFATNDHFGFDFVLMYINPETLEVKKYHWKDFASFRLCLNFAIEKALEILKLI